MRKNIVEHFFSAVRNLFVFLKLSISRINKIQNRKKNLFFYSRFQLDWERNVAQSMEIDPCPSDAGVEAMRPSHSVDPAMGEIKSFVSKSKHVRLKEKLS